MGTWLGAQHEPRWLRGGFAKASQRLHENGASFLATPSLERAVLFGSSSCRLPIIFRQFDCNLPVVLLQPSGSHLQVTLNINLWHATAIKAHNTIQPRSGFACVNVTGLRELASRGIAARNVSHKCLRGPFASSPRSSNP